MSTQLIKNHTSKKSPASEGTGNLRIIAGKWRSRKLLFPIVEGLRPSSSRIRETLFNWLTPMLPGSCCLDLFAGSGALGFEALSRGVASVTMIERHPQVVQQLRKNKALLNAENLQIIKQDARRISSIKGHFDIVFCDPPFNQNLLEPLLKSLHQSDLLNSNASIYIESEKSLLAIPLAPHWTIIKDKTAGDVRYRLINVGKC